MATYSGTAITTELIQKYLDENKQLILAILDNQNLGKLNECASRMCGIGNVVPSSGNIISCSGNGRFGSAM
jgi:hypothetical protein